MLQALKIIALANSSSQLQAFGVYHQLCCSSVSSNGILGHEYRI